MKQENVTKKTDKTELEEKRVQVELFVQTLGKSRSGYLEFPYDRESFVGFRVPRLFKFLVQELEGKPIKVPKLPERPSAEAIEAFKAMAAMEVRKLFRAVVQDRGPGHLQRWELMPDVVFTDDRPGGGTIRWRDGLTALGFELGVRRLNEDGSPQEACTLHRLEHLEEGVMARFWLCFALST